MKALITPQTLLRLEDILGKKVERHIDRAINAVLDKLDNNPIDITVDEFTEKMASETL